MGPANKMSKRKTGPGREATKSCDCMTGVAPSSELLVSGAPPIDAMARISKACLELTSLIGGIMIESTVLHVFPSHQKER